MKINEIFRSIDGECNGFKGAGQPSTFIRLQGCNLRPRCTYCDTPGALVLNNGKEMSIDEMLREIDRIAPWGNRAWGKVTITGGEPLLQAEELKELVRRLLHANLVTIETNGSIPIPGYFSAQYREHLRFVVDYKLGEQEKFMVQELFESLPPWDVIKFVVRDWPELRRAGQLICEKGWEASKAISPVMTVGSDMSWPRIVAEYISETKELRDVQFNLQVHKVLGVK